MTNGLKAFDFNGNDIRVIDMDGEPWFPAKDVCDLLDLGSPTTTVKNACLETEYSHIMKSNLNTVQVSFPNRGMMCVNESGLYALIFTSRKPEARAFRLWVTSDVLPSIRQTGAYAPAPAAPEVNPTPTALPTEADADAFTLLLRTIEALHKENRELKLLVANPVVTIEAPKLELKCITPAPAEWMTVAEFVKKYSLSLVGFEFGDLGYKTTVSMTRDGMQPRKVPKPRSRTLKVNSYPEHMIERTARSMGLT